MDLFLERKKQFDLIEKIKFYKATGQTDKAQHYRNKLKKIDRRIKKMPDQFGDASYYGYSEGDWSNGGTGMGLDDYTTEGLLEKHGPGKISIGKDGKTQYVPESGAGAVDLGTTPTTPSYPIEWDIAWGEAH